MQKNARIWAAIACFFAAIAAFWPTGARADQIAVFAASSLHDAVSEIALAYEDETGTTVALVFAASSTLARQVAQGAPADVVILADVDWAEWLVDQGQIETAVPIARNRLVLIAPQGTAALSDPADLPLRLGDSVLAIAQSDSVPAGRYGKAALVSLDLWDGLVGQIVQAANVRAALRFVERGEAPFGIGYASDLVALPALTEVYRFAPETHPDIVYSGGLLTPKGEGFLAYIQSDTGVSVLERWGFAPATKPQ